MNTVLNQKEITVGVDTGSRILDIHLWEIDHFFQVENNAKGIAQAIRKLTGYRIKRIVIEATGRLEHDFVLACDQAGLPFSIANPVHVRRFAQAIGQLAKTDKIDARIIAHYGEALQPKCTKLKPKLVRQIGDWVARRTQLISMQTAEKNRLEPMPAALSASIKRHLRFLQKEIEKCEEKLHTLMSSEPDFKANQDILMSVPGVGKVVVTTLFSYLPELGSLTNKQAAALIGVAPMNRESGLYQGQRRIAKGRHQVRTAMYMAMMSAMQCNPVFKAVYQRLVAAGKPKKVAIIACVRKMIVILNAMVRDGTKWNPNFVR